MRVPLASAVVFMIGITVGDADAAYLIQLKNGNDYVTSRYWRDGSQVLFDTYGGVFGVDKNFVAQIIKTDQVARFANATDREPGNKLGDDGLNDKKAVDDNSNEETILRQRGDDNDPIRGEFNRLKEKANEVNGMLTAEIRELLNQITAFKNKVTKDSRLFFEYGREFNDAQEIGNTVETALRTRTQ